MCSNNSETLWLLVKIAVALTTTSWDRFQRLIWRCLDTTTEWHLNTIVYQTIFQSLFAQVATRIRFWAQCWTIAIAAYLLALKTSDLEQGMSTNTNSLRMKTRCLSSIRRFCSTGLYSKILNWNCHLQYNGSLKTPVSGRLFTNQLSCQKCL